MISTNTSQESESRWIKVSCITLVFPEIKTSFFFWGGGRLSGLVSKPFNKLSGLEYMADFLKASWNKTGKYHIKKLKEPYFFVSNYKANKVHLLSYAAFSKTGTCKNFVSLYLVWLQYDSVSTLCHAKKRD